MVGALQSGGADLTISEVSVTTDRQRVIDFSTILSVIRCVGGGARWWRVGVSRQTLD